MPTPGGINKMPSVRFPYLNFQPLRIRPNTTVKRISRFARHKSIFLSQHEYFLLQARYITLWINNKCAGELAINIATLSQGPTNR